MNFKIPDECDDWINWVVADFEKCEAGIGDDVLLRMFVPQDDERDWVVNLVRRL